MTPVRGVVLAVAFLAPDLLPAATAPDWVIRALGTRVDSQILQAKPAPDAVVLWRQQIVTAAPGTGSTKLYNREAVRILSPQGASAATFLSTYDSDSRVDVEGGWTVHADGKVERLDLGSVVSFQLAHPEYFTDTFVIAFQPPRLSPGDVAASAFNRKSRRDVFQWILPLQGSHPIAAQEVVVDLPDGWTHRWRLTAAPDRYSGALSGEGLSKASYRLGPQRAVVDEEAAPPATDVLPMFELAVIPPPGKFPESVFASWNDVATWARRKLLQARSDPPADVVATLQQDVRRDAARYVQERIRYVAVEVGEGGYVPRDASLVAKRLYGDCKDKSFLLMALLKERGVVSYPVLTRSRDDGRIDATFPSPIQFNHLILAIQVSAPTGLDAEIRLRDGAAIVFDATDPSTPYGQLPASLQGAFGLVIRDGGGELLELPYSRSITNRFIRTIDADIGVDGALQAKVAEADHGAFAFPWRLQDTSVREMELAIERLAEDSLPGSRASRLGGPAPGSAAGSIEWSFSVSSKEYLRRSGEVFLLPVVPFSVGPRRISRLADRRFPIVLGAPAARQLVATFRLPDGFRVDALPDPIEVENRYARYRLSVSREGNRIVSSEAYETKEREIPASEVGVWKALETAAARAAAGKAVILREN